MFVSEARLVSRLNHANIVQIFDFDRHENTFYIAMEYIRGSPWHRRTSVRESSVSRWCPRWRRKSSLRSQEG